jgi:secretion/DNA translocation related TadE-like protein
MTVAARRGISRDQDGAGTIVSVAMMGLIVIVTVAASGVVSVVASHRRAQAAADLTALAGAAALQDGGNACERAAAIAERNGSRLSGCEVDGWNVAVTVVVSSVRLPGGPLELPARGRAGPVGVSAPGQ